mgnify:CR=1 FL=1
MSKSEEGTTVTVTSKGQATIPKKFREKLHIDTPGRVRFVETADGEIVIRPVTRPSELRGGLASEPTAERETLPSEQLREERERDRETTEETFGSSEQDR